MTTKPVIICAALTGAVPSKADNPAVPVTVEEIIASAKEAFDAGATIAHVHARGDDGKSSSDINLFRQIKEGIEAETDGMIVQISTGGRGRNQNSRMEPLALNPEMGSIATGTVNFATQIYENHPELVTNMAKMMLDNNIKPEVEAFDMSMIYTTKALIDKGLMRDNPHIQLVLGIPNAMPALRKWVEFGVSQIEELVPNATWCAAGIGRHQLEVARWMLELGGHVRTGLEDNLKFDRTRLANSNAELVQQVVDICPEYNRHPASVAEAREILNLPLKG